MLIDKYLKDNPNWESGNRTIRAIPFERNTLNIFLNGLLKINEYFQMKKSSSAHLKLSPCPFKEDMDNIDKLIGYAEEQLLNNEPSIFGVHISVRSLRYFKAALIIELMTLEQEQDKQNITTIVKSAIDKQIKLIQSKIDLPIFNTIKPADCIFEYSDEMKPKTSKEKEQSMSTAITKEKNCNDQESLWNEIAKQFQTTKVHFGKRINFVPAGYKREIIFRDIAHAFGCHQNGFNKPAVILSGAVIEELLRCYLEKKGVKPAKNDFFGYIETCKEKALLKDSIASLSHSFRDFRNIVHIKKEESKRHAISGSTAIGAISAIFTVANDFH